MIAPTSIRSPFTVAYAPKPPRGEVTAAAAPVDTPPVLSGSGEAAVKPPAPARSWKTAGLVSFLAVPLVAGALTSGVLLAGTAGTAHAEDPSLIYDLLTKNLPTKETSKETAGSPTAALSPVCIVPQATDKVGPIAPPTKDQTLLMRVASVPSKSDNATATKVKAEYRALANELEERTKAFSSALEQTKPLYEFLQRHHDPGSYQMDGCTVEIRNYDDGIRAEMDKPDASITIEIYPLTKIMTVIEPLHSPTVLTSTYGKMELVSGDIFKENSRNYTRTTWYTENDNNGVLLGDLRESHREGDLTVDTVTGPGERHVLLTKDKVSWDVHDNNDEWTSGSYNIPQLGNKLLISHWSHGKPGSATYESAKEVQVTPAGDTYSKSLANGARWEYEPPTQYSSP